MTTESLILVTETKFQTSKSHIASNKFEMQGSFMAKPVSVNLSGNKQTLLTLIVFAFWQADEKLITNEKWYETGGEYLPCREDFQTKRSSDTTPN